MAYRNYFRSLLNDNFKILTWVLILFIAITPNFIFIQSARAANVGGWNLSNPVAKGASAVYDATKNVVINGKDFIKNSSVKITPTATQVAKTIGRTAGVIIAIEMLIGALDWVLDPANNRVIYYEAPPPKEFLPKLWVWDSRLEGKDGVSTAQQACKNAVLSKQQALQYGSFMYSVFKSVSYTGPDSATCTYEDYNTYTDEKYPGNSTHDITRKVNTDYNPDAVDERQEKYLPYDAVAQKLISNASTGQPEAQAHTMAAAATEVAEAETDQSKARPIASQAEANAETKPADADAAASANTGAATATPQADPVTGDQAPPTDISLEFPVFCNWAPIVCEAAQTAVNFMSDYEPDAESGEVTIYQDTNIIFDDSQRVNFSNSCPSPEQFSVSFFGATQNLEFSYQPLCNFMTMIKPFVVAGSYVIGAYIVMGLSRGSAE